MSPLTILIIRHAEKPGEAWTGPGLTVEGVPNKKSLVIRGWQRAGSWAALFGPSFGGTVYPQPARIYAANPDVTNGEEPSQRPFETVVPLSERLGLTTVTTYAAGQEPALAAELVGLTGEVVLVCWEHKAIVHSLLPAIADDQKIPGLPTKWDGTRFDVVLRFDRASPETPWTFQQLFPRLLSGDSDMPLQ